MGYLSLIDVSDKVCYERKNINRTLKGKMR